MALRRGGSILPDRLDSGDVCGKECGVANGVAARCTVALLALTALVAGAAPAGGAVSASYVVMYSDGDYIGGGVQRIFDSGNATINVSGTAGYLQISVAGGTFGDSYSLVFAAPPGESLASGGVYVDAQRAPFREAGHPGIDISGSGRGCNTDTGLFEVKDIGIGSGGAITRLWIVYEQHCEGGTAALWGEVRIGEPTSSAPLVAPGIVRWPATDVGKRATVVPVTVAALDSPASITAATIVGSAAADFLIRSNECSGVSLAVGGRCQVWVRFIPTTAGTRLATLRLTDGLGIQHDVALQGFAYGGSTRLSMTSDPGDYIGAGNTYSYTVANAAISMAGSHSYAGFGISGADGSWWYGDFDPGQGDILVAGATYDNAHRYPFNGTGPGLDVSGNGRGCNTLTGSFSVTWTNFGPDGRLRSLGLTFVQHCEGMTPALHGTFEFRAGDSTPLAPWMIGTTPSAQAAPTITAFGPASGPPGTSVTITGTNFANVTSVAFGGTQAVFAVGSSTQLTASVPLGAATGRITVTTPGGTATSTQDFVVTAAPPPTTTTTVTTATTATTTVPVTTTVGTTTTVPVTTTVATTTTVPVTTTVTVPTTTTVATTNTVTTTVPSTTTVTTPGATTTVTTPGPTTTVTTPGPTTTVTTTTGATSPLTPPARQDATPPNTRIVGGPADKTTLHRALFRFVSSESRSTFQCKLDRGRWQSCRSPKAYRSLALGRHRIYVRAVDDAGNVDPTPAWRLWRIR
jgi:hypothetical protein